MGSDEIPFNMSVHFDARLKEVPDDEEQMKKGISFLKEKVVDENHPKLAGLLGVYSRILGNLQEAEWYLNESIEMYRDNHNKRGLVANKLRLAHVFQWKENYYQADTLFKEVMIEIKQDSALKDVYLDFAYQHYGKSKFDQEDYHEALELFQQALTIRRKKGDYGLIQSTQQAILQTKECLQSGQ
ncbi:tetratricopeptide (TPR) repeat protein [Geomicrobium halophilum]|uniref:Tetratricopeptide (TPR) repeat protein n=1 Tax=Geomicrobium halophilum TaxID=549000 RepID=A0A841PH77_9BACL|nr:tetratricopeptide repeat protein [Geomicrobium halophilum]MBB6448099.1 tetratricopeptide (TPR) repeat protein [Geomicrobium halophilum]